VEKTKQEFDTATVSLPEVFDLTVEKEKWSANLTSARSMKRKKRAIKDPNLPKK